MKLKNEDVFFSKKNLWISHDLLHFDQQQHNKALIKKILKLFKRKNNTKKYQILTHTNKKFQNQWMLNYRNIIENFKKIYN